ARQSVEALAAAHAAGLVHRDIKPSNLWLEPPTTAQPFGRVRLLDFGLAQIEAEEATLTSTGVALGTPAYLSPE
ncbi:MAG: protein kinase domain-containing protein, partial [Gemmataceae bacterium]